MALCIHSLAQPEAVERGLPMAPAHRNVAAWALPTSDLDLLVWKVLMAGVACEGAGRCLTRAERVCTPGSDSHRCISQAKALSRWAEQTDNTEDRGA